MCVYDIASILNMTQSAISHQLRILKQNRLVKFRKEGKTVLYTLADEHVFTILRQGLSTWRSRRVFRFHLGKFSLAFFIAYDILKQHMNNCSYEHQF